MLPTYVQYEVYARNLDKSFKQVESQGAVKTAKAYYDANIGKVKSVDDLLGNYRLLTYAMKAYGLQDMTYAKALMRRVLTSDLSDPNSVANKLTDSRYRAIAKAFNFTTSGAVPSTSIQTADQQSATVTAFASATAQTLDAATAREATAYFKSHIGNVSSVGDFVKDQKLTAYVLTAYGLAASTPAADVAALLKSDLSDPASALNTTAGAGYLALREAVNVGSAGAASVPESTAQSHDAALATATAYMANAGSDTRSRTAAKAETTYYSNTIGTITSADALLGDSRLMAYIAKAFGLPSNLSAATLRQIVTSDPGDPASLANTTTDPAIKAAASAFNFSSTGQLRARPFQDAAQQRETVMLHAARQKTDSSATDAATQYYEAHIGAVTSVGDLERDPQLYNYVLSAYGIAASTPSSTVEKVMEDVLPGATDTARSGTGILARTAAAGDLAFARAFTVDPAGRATAVLAAQSATGVSATTTAYMATARSDAPSQRTAKAETDYYKATIGTVSTVGDLLSNARLVAYVRQAYAVPSWLSTAQLRSMLTGAVAGSGSLGTIGKALQADFSFASSGLLSLQAPAGAQSATQRSALSLAYDRQVMETDAGSKGTGVQLALYLQRVGPTITDAYSILADKALLQVFQTTLGIPAASSKESIDTQASYLASRINFADFKNPAKLDKMVQRFAAMYDLANPSTAQSDTVSMLFGTGSG